MSAALLFLMEPMFAKMALPILGGTPAVWNTCMVFYQAALLAGYAYANASTQRLGARRQAALHVGLLLIPLFFLPIRLPAGWTPPVERNPIPWLLAILTVCVGLPFFILSTITPSLQKWFANTNHPSARDPYFLYAASNLGSILGLLSYPVLIEPHLRLTEQSRLWAYGYAVLVALIVGCAIMFWRSPRAPKQNSGPEAWHNPSATAPISGNAAAPTFGQRMRWVALAFVPSSLMLGVTTALTTEIPPIPLFWVIPLAIYLLSFVLVFARKPIIPHSDMVDRLPFLILATLIPTFAKAELPVWLGIILNLLTLFVATMVCHGELARSRPSTENLTEFYLWMSAGGVLGGVFNALVAPLVFRTVTEFPLILFLAALLRPRARSGAQTPRFRWLDFGLPLAAGAVVVGLAWGLQRVGLKPGTLLHVFSFGPALLLCLSFKRRPIRFGLGIGALLLASTFYTGAYGHILRAERSFYGIYRITDSEERKYRLLFHGSTIHGMQSLAPERGREPLSYYSRSGPIGQIFTAFSGTEILNQVAIVGLGAGSMACYGEPGQQFTFYEIDPLVERIARDLRYFTFLRDCPPTISVVLGDARLSLKNSQDRRYGMIVLDAFSADAIPVHLVTREAIQLYLSKLAEDGILVFHISNRYLDLQPVLGNLAKDAGLAWLVRDDTNVSNSETQNGKFPSRWFVMARTKDTLAKLAGDRRWKEFAAHPGARVWTDDFSSILSILKWD